MTANAGSLRPDYAASIKFLQAFRPTGFWLLTAISPDKKSVETRPFSATEPDRALAWLEERGKDHNIYFSVNPTVKPMTKKAEREDIAQLAFLHVDIDPRPGEELESERARALKMLTERLPESVPPPTWIIDSGGGFHGYWQLRQPPEIDGDSGRYEDAKRYNQQLEVLFDGDSCHNVDRIMRLPGTINRPDKNKVAKGRSARLSVVVEHDASRVYDLSQFTPAPLVQQTGDLGFTGNLVKIDSDNVERLDHVDDLGDKVPQQCKIIIVQGDDPDDPKRFPSRSEAVFYVACQLVRSGVPDERIYSVLTDAKFGISQSILETGRRAQKYALRQIERAKEDAIHPRLRELNERHAVIEDIDGKCRIISEVADVGLERGVLTYQSFEDFKNRYGNVEVDTGEDKSMPLGIWWIRHPQRRQYKRVVFVPGRDVPGCFNLWRGFAVEAKPGSCERFFDHVRRNICGSDEKLYLYVVGWMAHAVQKPDEQGHVAIVLRGSKGAGKGKFATTFGRLFGRHFLQVTDAKHLVGSFNAHLRDCSVLFADEAFYAGDKKHESVLKSLVTEDSLMVEGKGVNAVTARNYLHIIMASNERWVIPTGAHERRFLMLDVSDGNLQDRKFFAAIDEEQEHGGREALLHFLLHYDLSGFDVRAVPKTDALRDQQERSLPPLDEWIHGLLEEGELPNSPNGHAHRAYSNETSKGREDGLYDHARRTVPRLRDMSDKRLGKALKESGAKPWKPRGAGRGWEFPPLDIARRDWDERMGLSTEWPDGDSWRKPEGEPF